VLSALLYLRLTSFKNWVLTRLRSLRHPKQLAGAVAFALYFWFFFLRHWTSAPRETRRAAAQATEMLQLADTLPAHWQPAAAAFGAVALFVFIALMWIIPTQRAALGFTEAEIAFLFPAPVTRRALVHFRLLSGQLRSLVGATVMMLISNRWSFLGGNVVTHALGWWFVFSALNLHYSGATFTLTRLSDVGFGAVRRRIYVLLLVLIVAGLTFARLPPALRLPATDDALVLRPFTDWIINLTSTAPLSWLLWPFRLVVSPFLAPDVPAFLLALGPALLVIGAHYLWVVRSAVAFEESAIDYAQKRGARIAAWRSGQRQFGGGPIKPQREPFRLPGLGRPEFGFLWKNLLSTWPYFRPKVFLAAAVVIVAGCQWLASDPELIKLRITLGAGAGIFAAYLLIVGPHFARQDIRSDLANADILKTYPLPGWQIVLGELLAPVAILTSVLWLALLTAALAFQPRHPPEWFDLPFRISCATWLALLLPAVVSLQLLVPNAAALVFPGWVHAQRARGAVGPEVAGQRMIFFFAQIVTMAVALLPAGGLAALLILIMRVVLGFSHTLAINLAALPVLVILVAEVWCGLWLLGQRFEKLDLSAELRP
jgi:ABC-2 type transport system permease protein